MHVACETTTIATPTPADLDPREAVDEAWLAMIDRMAAVELASRSTAELVWDSLESEDQTGVWAPDEVTGAGEIGDPASLALEPTRVDIMLDRDTARHRAVPMRLDPTRTPTRPPAVVEDERAADELPVFATSQMPPSRAALLLRLAPNGYAGSGEPIDAAVVPRGQILAVGKACPGPWAGDPYLDDHHVRFLTDTEGVRVIDDGSRGGVWMRFSGSRWLRDGDWFRIGEQFLCYDAARPADEHFGRIQLIDQELRFGPAIEIDDITVLGREAADVVLLHDPFVSGEHCRIVPNEDGVALEDLSSSNGTWMRLRSGDLIPFGAVVAIGRSLYRVDAAER